MSVHCTRATVISGTPEKHDGEDYWAPLQGILNNLHFFYQPENGGVVMVNFYNDYVTCNKNATLEDVAGKTTTTTTTKGARKKLGSNRLARIKIK